YPIASSEDSTFVVNIPQRCHNRHLHLPIRFVTFEPNKTYDYEEATAFGCRVDGIFIYPPGGYPQYGKTGCRGGYSRAKRQSVLTGLFPADGRPAKQAAGRFNQCTAAIQAIR